MGAPFESRPMPEQGFFGRILGRVHREALLADVESALAAAADWANVTRDEIAALEASHGGSLKEYARGEAIMLVCKAADHLDDQQVVEGGVPRLRNLAAALDMRAEAETIVISRARKALGAAARGLIADGDLSDADRAAWAEAARACGFASDAVDDILADAVTARMKDEIAAAMADDRLSAEEEARIDELGHALSARLQLDDTTTDALARARRLWRVEEGPLEPVSSPIALPSAEICLYAGYGQAMEPRTRGAKSFTFSYGSGDIVLTTKRILFNGGARNIAIQLGRIVDFRLFDDGVEVRRATGKPVTFALNAKDEWFARLFVRAHDEAAR